LRYLYALIGGAMILLLLFVLLNSYVLTYYRVDGQSMYPTLHNEQLLGVNLLAYVGKDPQPNDVVIVRYAGDHTINFVKRVIAGPGMTVQFQGAPLTLGLKQYFVEGDNRLHSTDSRVFGPIDRSQIVGEVLGNYPLPNNLPADN